MNRIKYISLMAIVGFFFLSCQDSLKNEIELNQANNRYTVRGLISSEGLVRSAIASIPDNLIWTVTAEKEETEVELEVENGSYSFEAEEGEWTFKAYGKKSDGKIIFEGSKTQNITEETVVVIEVTLAEGKGSIALSIYDETGKAKTAKCVLKSGNETRETITSEFGNNRSAFLQKSEISTGSYDAEITIYDNDEKVIYACKEIINVYSNLETDKWLGNSSYITNGKFVLDNENISNYLLKESYTPYVLWNRKGKNNSSIRGYSTEFTGEYVRQYWDGFEVLNDLDNFKEVTEPLFVENSYSWCFDDEKSLFAVRMNQEYDDQDVLTEQSIKIVKYELNKQLYYPEYELCEIPVVEQSTGLDTISVYNIAWASYENAGSKHEYLYLMYRENNSDIYLNVYDITNWKNTTTVTEAFVSQTNPGWNIQNADYSINIDEQSARIAAQGNKMYLSCSQYDSSETKYWIYVLPFTLNGNSLSCDNIIIDISPNSLINDFYDSAANNGNSNYEIGYYVNDAQIIEGRLYVLLSLSGGMSNQDFGKYYYSSGGIAKINLSNNSVESWPDGSKIFGWLTKDVEMLDSYLDEETNQWVDTSKTVQMSAIPSGSALQTHFYGPRRIIAKKPDEIVIADDGWEYLDEEDSIKNHDRIVTVSLKTWAISDIQDADCMFDGYVARLGTGNACWTLSVND